MTLTYSPPTIATAATPKPETWSDVRCPACVPLGWYTSRALFRVYGKITPSGAVIHIRCPRCRSMVAWECGTLNLRAVEQGPKNNRKSKVAFE